MIILDIDVKECPVCHQYNGWAKERYNGTVPVYCRCGLAEQIKKYKKWKSPCMICPKGDKIGWTPISDHLEEDGRWWHTQHLGARLLSIRHDRFRSLKETDTTMIESKETDERNEDIILMQGANFVLIPAGSFQMGSPWDELQRGEDETPHYVTISKPFYLQTTPVTQGQWKSVMGNNPSQSKGDDKLPVECVSWFDVQKFISKLNSMDGTDKYRLPTEAEWEYACRAGTTTRFYSGNKDMSNAGWCDCKITHPVGQKIPNAWGLYDMHGNVWEWVEDWWADFSSGSVTDPTGPPEGLFRVVRGGSWLDADFHCRSEERSDHDPGNRYNYVGFRLIKTHQISQEDDRLGKIKGDEVHESLSKAFLNLGNPRYAEEQLQKQKRKLTPEEIQKINDATSKMFAFIKKLQARTGSQKTKTGEQNNPVEVHTGPGGESTRHTKIHRKE